MSLIYIPTNFQFTQIRLPVFGKTPWGLDTASVVWGGPAPKLDAFLKSLRQGSALPACSGFHPAYSKMFLTSWNNSDDADFPMVTLSYVGTLNGALPDPIVSRTVQSQSVSIMRTTTIVDGNPDNTSSKLTRFDVLYETEVLQISAILDNPAAQPETRLSLSFYRIVRSEWEIVDSPNERQIGWRGAGVPPSLNLRTSSSAPLVNPIPGTPYFEYSSTAFFELS